MGPNLRLSWMMAWKKQNPNNNFLNSVGFRQLLNYSSLIELYDLIKLALNPWGGSSVIFTPFCNTDIGNVGVGIDVSHSLKSGWVASLNYYTSFYSDGIQDAAKWQFWSRIQLPFA